MLVLGFPHYPVFRNHLASLIRLTGAKVWQENNYLKHNNISKKATFGRLCLCLILRTLEFRTFLSLMTSNYPEYRLCPSF